jgi:hypothetical protein
MNNNRKTKDNRARIDSRLMDDGLMDEVLIDKARLMIGSSPCPDQPSRLTDGGGHAPVAG